MLTPLLNVRWPVRRFGRPSLSDGYALFGALCRGGWLVHAEPNVQVLLRPGSLLVRCEPGKAIEMMTGFPRSFPLGPGRIDLGRHDVSPPRPAAACEARLVVVKGAACDGAMRAACVRQLGQIGVGGRIEVGGRGVTVVGGVRIVGYAVRVAGLSPADSLTLQARGLGGKQRMGCGVFLPC